MRIVDPRIRTVARAINPAGRGEHHGDYRDHWWQTHGTLDGYAAWMAEWWDGRRDRRRSAIDAAVRVLRHLDDDVIDGWTETIPSCGGEIRGWINPPHRTDTRVHVTVSNVGPAPGPIDGLTDDEADRFADAIREGR